MTPTPEYFLQDEAGALRPLSSGREISREVRRAEPSAAALDLTVPIRTRPLRPEQNEIICAAGAPVGDRDGAARDDMGRDVLLPGLSLLLRGAGAG